MPRVRNKYCDIIESITAERVNEYPYDSWKYRAQVAQAIFFKDIPSWNYIEIAKEIDVYPIVVWQILENWIRYGILSSDGKIVLDDDAYETELAAHVELTLICLCGAGILERQEVSRPSLSTKNDNPYQAESRTPLLSNRVEQQIQKELEEQSAQKELIDTEIRFRCFSCGRRFKQMPEVAQCPYCQIPVAAEVIERSAG